jgi:small conductance mechanosensitive channel
MSIKDAVMALLIQYGFQVLGGLLILAGGLYVTQWMGKLTDRQLLKLDLEPQIRRLLGRLARALMLLLTLLVVLQQFGIQVLPFIAGLGIIGVGVGLAAQGVLGSLIAGLTIIFTKPFRIGEYIELLDVYGEVQDIGLFSTKLLHPDRSQIVIPNRQIIGEILHNYGSTRQLNLNVGVAYDTDLPQALQAARAVVETSPRVLKEPAPVVGISLLGDSAITVSIKPWVRVTDFGAAEAELYQALVERFRVQNIQIPFPQHEVRLIGAA